MAIIKKVVSAEHPKGGDPKHLVLPAFSFATDSASADGLANLIIDAWGNVLFTYTTGGVTAARPLRANLEDRDLP